MPGGTSPTLGNNAFGQSLYASITPAASVGSASSTTSTYTISGLAIGDLIDVYPQAALPQYLSLGSVWVATANTLSIQWVNSSASTSSGSPAALSCGLIVNRPQNIAYGISQLPTTVI